ncbi:MAG TPA: DUF2071 domain-containing protein, partial [Gemmatimonadales bacterium]|nr:DUF2071 domain-containing protein [Gemmatimonadales bacterium]
WGAPRDPRDMHRPFLTARWECLVLLNYWCPPDLLASLVPTGTELDLWRGRTLVSLVGFLFRDTRLRGIPVPFHRTFEEVNLRFYVRRPIPGGPPRRAVVFIRELVPRRAIALVARWAYNEPYLAVPMSHGGQLDPGRGGRLEYAWRYAGAGFALGAVVTGPSRPNPPGSEAEFITEHYWGYTRQPDGGTLEYRVEHPSWAVWDATRAYFTGPATALYGPAFGAVLEQEPSSAFVAVGSPVAVHAGHRLPGRAG